MGYEKCVFALIFFVLLSAAYVSCCVYLNTFEICKLEKDFSFDSFESIVSCFFPRETGDILLKICNLMPQDTGIYTCIAINDHGTASSSASIKVQGNVEKGDAQLSDVSFISIMQDIVGEGHIYLSFVIVNRGVSMNHSLIDVFHIYAHVKVFQQPQLDL